MATSTAAEHDQSTWELSKENVKPVRSGRKVNCISAVFQPSKIDMERLMFEKQQFEEEILAAENKDDPLEPWDRYMKWTIQYFPSGGSDMNLLNLLKKLITRFQSCEEYKNDVRYVKAWLTLAEICDDPLETFSYMNTQGIGSKCSEFFVAWADEYEKYGDFRRADRIYLDADEKCVQPRDLLLKKHTEFQLRVARSMDIKNSEVEDTADDTSQTNDNSRLQHRTALGALKGRGKHQTVGTKRTGTAMQPHNHQTNSGSSATVSQPQQGSGKFSIFEDNSQGVNVMGEKGQWTSAPSTDKSKENTQKPGQWKGVKVKQKHVHSNLSASVPAPPKTNFTFYQEDQASLPSSSRKVACNVESVLSEKKSSDKGIKNSFASVIEAKPVHGPNTVSAYSVEKVYSVMGEMQFEEVRAAIWRHRRKERERAKEEEERLIEERKRAEALRAQQQKLDEEQRRLAEERMRLMERERKFIEDEQKRMEMWQKKMLLLENQLKIIQSQEKTCKTAEDQQKRLQEEEDVTVQLNSVKMKMKHASMSMPGQRLEDQALGKVSPEFEIFDENVPAPLQKEQGGVDTQLRGQSGLSNSLRMASSANNSLNHSKRSQPSPTLYTKEALGEVYNWFQNPFPESADTTCNDGAQALPGPREDPGTYFMPIKDAPQPAQPLPNFPVSAIRSDTSTGFTIFTDENDGRSVQRSNSVQPAVKRKGLKEIVLPPDQAGACSENENHEMELQGCQPIDGDKTGFYFDEVTVAGSHFAAKAQLASTPFCGRAGKLQDMTDVSRINTDVTETENAALANKSILPPFLLERNPPAYETLFEPRKEEEEAVQPKQFLENFQICSESERKESVFSEEPNQLSTIMEASNESEKSSALGGTRSSRSDSETEKSLHQATHHVSKALQSIEPEDVARKSSSSLSDCYYGGFSLDLWGNGDGDNENAPETNACSNEPKGLAEDLENEKENEDSNFDVSSVDSVKIQEYLQKTLNVDDVCAELESASIVDTTETQKDDLSLWNIVANPWGEELLTSILSRSENRDKTVGSVNKTTAPKLRKGSTVQLGSHTLIVGKLIGQGAYAKIYEVFDAPLSQNGQSTKVIKFQQPPCRWEVHALNQAMSRLRAQGMESASSAIVDIDSAHYYTDASIFIMPRLYNGTLLDMVNAKKGTRMKDAVVMWIAGQVMRIVHSLHTVGIIHGDIKPDNFMLENMRSFDFTALANEIAGLKLIDFGRAIDMNEFPPATAFTQNCGTSGFSCIQMQTKQPWNYHTDFYGVAGTIHVVLFGTYMQVHQEKDGKWAIKERVKRWFNTSLWNDFFSSLLNYPSPSDGRPLTLDDSPLPRLISKMHFDSNELEEVLPNFFRDV